MVMPVFGVHRDPNVFENPHRFDPERFLPESKTMRDPYSFAPFGHGKYSIVQFSTTKAKCPKKLFEH